MLKAEHYWGIPFKYSKAMSIDHVGCIKKWIAARDGGLI